jgi:multicomponent Na+:H+ antiporter subunit E
MRSRIALFVVCMSAWLAMWGDISVANLASGLIAIPAVLWLSSQLPGAGIRHTLHPLGVLRLLAHFVRLLWLSNWTVVKTSLRPTPAALRAAIVAAPLTQRSPLVTTIVSNFVTLTPGTLTLDAVVEPGQPPVLYIHVLGFVDVEAVRSDVAQIERWAIAAVTPDAASFVQPGGPT